MMLVETRLKALQNFYARIAEGKTHDDEFVERFLSYREQHESLVREIQRLCVVVQDQISGKYNFTIYSKLNLMLILFLGSLFELLWSR